MLHLYMTYGFVVLDPSMSNHIKQFQEFYTRLWQNMISIVKHIFMEMQSEVCLANLFTELIEIGLTTV